MKLALISTSDKSNLINLCNFLLKNDYNIISTGGTYKHIIENIESGNIDLDELQISKRVISVENFTGFPEILGGRVKTLHPKIYGGILYDPTLTTHVQDYSKFNDTIYKLEKIDLVVVNLYPFEETVEKNELEKDIIEQIDIGGVTLIRAAAKNYKHVMILTDPKDYQDFIDKHNYLVYLELLRKELALKAFQHTVEYDQNIVKYFDNRITYRQYTRQNHIKYGCNPYQSNAFISKIGDNTFPIEVLNGNPGYINYLDAFNSWLLVIESEKNLGYMTATSFKHTAPAGVGISRGLIEDLEIELYDLRNYLTEDLNNSHSGRAFIRARNCDALSSFGDFIAISGIVDETCAKLIKREVSDGIIARGYTEEALKILKEKKKGNYPILKGKWDIDYDRLEYREIMGVAMTQKCNGEYISDDYFKNVPTKNNELPKEKKEDLILATITLKYTPSNSITISNNGQVIGIGAGQQNRVDCIKLAGNKANIFNLKRHPKTINLLSKFKEGIKRQDKVNAVIKYVLGDFTERELDNWKLLFIGEIELLQEKEKKEFLENNFKEMVLSSDAFFPFRDNIDYVNRYNIKYILNPGGSIKDKCIIEACNEYNIYMALTGKRLFLH
jgi:phosphoribosylaminoimidazolecarboxamide formyltransferase / IMP cyclohydrolase